MKDYDYVIVGAGICGCTLAFELQKYSKSILLIDKLSDVGSGASGAAGAFLSPLLGKPNDFKNLVNTALQYSIDFYKNNFPNLIINKGVLRIPKNEDDAKKFMQYEKDLDYKERDGGYFFDIGSLVFSYEMCHALSSNVEKLLDYEVNKIETNDDFWIIDDNIKTKKLIVTTGADIRLLGEKYINIRAVWGQRIILETSTKLSHNYHKECSISLSFSSASDFCDKCPLNNSCDISKTDTNKSIVSIGATHHRFVLEKETNIEDTNKLLQLASDIVDLKDVTVIGAKGGARASSSDYFPMVGDIIDSNKTLENFPYLKKGTYVDPIRFSRYQNLFVLNGVGGRGFVLAPYLSQKLVESIVNNIPIDTHIVSDRLFKRWVKHHK